MDGAISIAADVQTCLRRIGGGFSNRIGGPSLVGEGASRLPCCAGRRVVYRCGFCGGLGGVLHLVVLLFALLELVLMRTPRPCRVAAVR